MPIIENYKTITIPLSFNAVNSINENIFVEFQPDEVILKSVKYYASETDIFDFSTNGPVKLTSSLINNEILYVMLPSTKILTNSLNVITGYSNDEYTNDFNINIRWKLNQSINNSFDFYLSRDTTVYTSTYIIMYITLEFRKYKQNNSYSA